MSEDKTISHTSYQQVLTLLNQVIEASIWEDAKLKSKDPIKKSGRKLHDK